MKRIATFFLGLGGVLGALAQSSVSLETTATVWAKAVTIDPSTSPISGNGQTTQGTNIALASDGSLYAFGNVGAGTVDSKVLFGSDVIANGTPYYNGNASPFTFALTRIAPDGTPQWCVYALNGEIGSGNGAVMPTADGGAVVVTTLRLTQGGEGRDPEFVHQGGEYTFSSPFKDKEKRFYCPFVMRVSADGNILWTRLFDTATTPQEGIQAEYISSGVSVNDAVLDDDENIYLAGNQRSVIYCGNQALAAHNIDGWNGDSQESVGNAFIIKLDKDGNYAAHVVTSGAMKSDNVRCLTYDNGRLFALLQVTGKGDGAAIELGGKSADVPANEALHLAAASFDMDLKAQWFQLYPNTINKPTALQVPRLKVLNGNLWLAAEGQMGINAGGKDVNTGALVRDGLLFKFNASTGEPLDGMTLAKPWGGIFDVVRLDGKRLLVPLFTGLYGNLNLAIVDSDDLAIMDQVTLLSSVSTAQNIAVNGDRLYVMARIRGIVNTIGSADAIQAAQFSSIIGAYQLPFTINDCHAQDVNSDGAVNVGDVNEVLTAIIGESANPLFDVNHDGDINVGDVNDILAYILGQ